MPSARPASPVTISFTVSYSIGADSVNKDQAFVLLSYLTGAGRHDQVDRGRRGAAVALGRARRRPARTCWPRAATTREPGSGFMPGYADVQKAFQDAFTAEIQNKTYQRRRPWSQPPRPPSTRR